MPSIDDYRAAQRVLSRRWLGRNAGGGARLAVHAMGIGHRCRNGGRTGTRVVQFFVEQKLRKSLLLRRDLIPTAIDGIRWTSSSRVPRARPAAVEDGGCRARSHMRARQGRSSPTWTPPAPFGRA